MPFKHRETNDSNVVVEESKNSATAKKWLKKYGPPKK